MTFLKHLFGRGRQRGMQEVKTRVTRNGGRTSGLRCGTQGKQAGYRFQGRRDSKQTARAKNDKVFQSRQPIDVKEKRRPRRIRASAIREATMYKENTLFLHSSVEDMCPNNVFGQTFSDSDWDVQDKRVAQLLVLLQQLHESPGGLGALPKPELGEVVSSAVRLCGFVNPIEARDVIDTVLASLEMEDPIPKHQ
jgi:hypothetical protein